MVLICALWMVGAPGIAQSQVGYYDGLGPYNDRYYDPYYYDGYGYGYDPYGYYDDDYDDGVLTDAELRARIRLDIAMSPFVDKESLRVSVENGVATLSGSVDDRSAMVDAVEIAYDAGAWKVRNKLRQRNIDARPWADMRDSELKQEIQEELAYSPFVNSDQISVSVRNGVATLYGGVENKGEIADAVENAYEAGAKRVESRLWVDSDLS
ncbi:MAG: BON domain-containing protein [Nitrospirales bacterium]